MLYIAKWFDIMRMVRLVSTPLSSTSSGTTYRLTFLIFTLALPLPYTVYTVNIELWFRALIRAY